MARAQEVVVRIRGIAVGGEGVGEVREAPAPGDEELLGITVFIPYTAPGETVRARITERRNRYLRGELLELIESGPDRIDPECAVYGSCGGCELQHMTYASQLQTKQQMIQGMLRAAKFGSDVLSRLEPVVPSQPFHYRQRVSLHIDAGGNVGFYRANSRSVVKHESCIVASAPINSVFPRLQEFGREVQRRITSVQLEADGEGVIAVLRSPYDLGDAEAKQIIALSKKYFENVVLLAGDKERGGFGRQILELPLTPSNTVKLKVPAGSFSQVNWEINQRLIADVIAEAEIARNVRVDDLFAGAGNFSVPAARDGARVIAVENEPRLVNLGRENASRYGLDNLTFVESTVEKYLSGKKQPADVIIADPPRSGLGGMASSLSYAKRLVLISCQLSSFVRDLRLLQDQGWQVELIRPYDMFAQTSYVEVLSVYSRS